MFIPTAMLFPHVMKTYVLSYTAAIAKADIN